MQRSLVLVLVLSAFALAAGWQSLAPKDEQFSCQLPPGKLRPTQSAHSRQWLLVERGKYALQVTSIAQPGTPSQVEFYLSEVLKSGKITVKGRKSVTVHGRPALQVVGALPPIAKVKVSVRIQVFSTKDHIYTQSAFLTGGGYQKVADQFFQSFRLK